VKPNFAYDTASDQNIWSWYVDANNYLTLFYDAGNDCFTLKWKDGGTERVAECSALGAGEVEDIWFDLAAALDLTTGDATGVSLNMRVGAGAWSEEDTSWADAADTRDIEFPLFEIRGENGTEGDYDVNYVRVFLSKECSATEIASDLDTIYEEETFFPLNGCGLGYDRVNISNYVIGLSPAKSCARIGGLAYAELRVSLDNTGGEFVDDQYDTYAPEDGVYNGTTTQRYLRQRPLVWLEHWYSNLFDSVFFGRVNRDHITRDTSGSTLNIADFDAEDRMAELMDYQDDSAHSYDSKNITDSTEADSLTHLIVRLATQKTVYNYLSNSSFENATIAYSWAVAGAGATFSRVADGSLFGSYQGDLVYGAATCTVTQTVTFLGTKKLNVGDYYTFSIWLKSADAAGNNITLAEHDTDGSNDSTTAAYVIAGAEGWLRFDVTRTLTDSDSDRLVCTVTLDDNVTLSMDGAMLVDDDPYEWFVLNNNDGASAVESADDADSDTYDTCGFVVDTVSLAIDWVLIPEYSSVGEHISDLGVAALAEFIGFDPAGTFVLDSYLDDAYSDPTPTELTVVPESMRASTDPQRANHIIVQGSMIKEDAAARNVITLKNTRFFEDGGQKIKIEMADGDVFPDVATYGAELWLDLQS